MAAWLVAVGVDVAVAVGVTRRRHRHHVALPIAPGEDALATIPERAAVIAQDLVEGKAKVTVGRSALSPVENES